MKEMIIGADLLPEAYTEKAVKSQDKCSESQPLAQEKYADFIGYLTEQAYQVREKDISL